MTSPIPPRLHLAHIDGLRALCALWVLLFHAYVPGYIFPLRLPLLFSWITWGHFAVPTFLVISGFCLTMPVVRKGELAGGAKHFYRKRIRRILPPYYIALLFFTIFRHIRDTHDIVSHFLLVQNFSPKTFYGDINASFWSIAVECQIYLLFPLFVALWRKWGLIRSASVLLPCAFLLNAAVQNTSLWGLCLHYTGLFLLGALGADIAFSSQPQVVRFRDGIAWQTAAGCFALLLISLTVAFGHATRDPQSDMTQVSGWQMSGYNLLVALTVSCLLISMTRQDTIARRVLSWKPLVWVGSFSYSLYLLHQPFVNSLGGHIPHNRYPAAVTTLMFLAFVPVLLAVTYLFHRCFERPFMSVPAPKTERQAEEAAVNSPAP